MSKPKEKTRQTSSVKYSCGHSQDIYMTGTKNVQIKKYKRKLAKSLCRNCYAAKTGVPAPVAAETQVSPQS